MKIAVIGAGFGGMSAAAYLAKAGHEVHVYEKNSMPGGRAQVLELNGFTFDLGPSWYMMPDVFEEFFADFDKKPSDYYKLEQLNPSYKVFFRDEELAVRPFPAALKDFEKREPGSGKKFGSYLQQVKREYEKVRQELLMIDGLSMRDFSKLSAMEMLLNPQMLGTFHQRISRVVKDEKLRKILEFMVVFLGGAPKNIPAMYGLLNWTDFGQGISYPHGGFGALARAFEQLAKEQGVTFHYNAPVKAIIPEGKHVEAIEVDGINLKFNCVVANADYHHVEMELLPEQWRCYGKKYWQDKTLSPSGVMALIGVKRKLPLEHHNLFFDAPWEPNFDDVFKKQTVGSEPLFYLSAPSRTDPTVAPKDCENLFLLIPVSNKADIDEKKAEELVDAAISRIEHKIALSFSKDIVIKQVIAPGYFHERFNAYLNNAFGLSHTLLQSGPLRPRIRSKKLLNLYFVGQYTNPGTGVPLVVLSGKVVANAINLS